jgi:hypothetical protein
MMILLPSIILTRCSKTILTKRLNDIKSNFWNITVGDLLSHQMRRKSSVDKEAVVRKYIRASRISKAMQCDGLKMLLFLTLLLLYIN